MFGFPFTPPPDPPSSSPLPICHNCGLKKSLHQYTLQGISCQGRNTLWQESDPKDVSTLPMKAADPLPLPDDSHTTKPTIDSQGFCLCGIRAEGCDYHKPDTIH